MSNTIAELLVNVLLKKCDECDHGCCCGEYMITQTIQTLKYAYSIKTIISFFGLIIKLFKNRVALNEILYVFLNKGTLKFCGFMCSYTMLVKFTLCLLRNIYKNNKPIYAFYSGCVAGFLSMFFLEQNQRKLFALYMIVRGLDSKFHNLQNKKYTPLILFTIMNLFTSYAYFFEEDCFGEAQMRTFQKLQNFSPREDQLRQLTNLSVYAK